MTIGTGAVEKPDDFRRSVHIALLWRIDAGDGNELSHHNNRERKQRRGPPAHHKRIARVWMDERLKCQQRLRCALARSQREHRVVGNRAYSDTITPLGT